MKPSKTSLLRTPARALATLALAATLVTLAACMSRPSPVKHQFLLEPATPAAVAAPLNASARIGMINAGASFRARTLVYRRDETTFESDFYNEFFVPPAAMLADAVAKALTQANVFQRVTASGAAPYEADYVLDGFVTDLYGDLREAGKPASVLTVTFYLSSTAAGVPRVVWSKGYRQRVVAANDSAEALVRGWNQALGTILGELTRDLAALQLPPKP